MDSVFWLLDSLLACCFWNLIFQVIVSWLAAFNVINMRQPVVWQIGRFLWQVTEPVLGPIRRVLGRMFGDLGGVDLSPIIGLLLVGFLRRMLAEMAVSIH